MAKNAGSATTYYRYGLSRSAVSTVTLKNKVSLTRYGLSVASSLECSMNIGHPDATFMGLVGRWKLELVGSGLKASATCLRVARWSSRARVTRCRNGHASSSS